MVQKISYPFQNDHDVFIALIQDFNNTMTEIDSRLEQDHQTTLEIQRLLEQNHKILSDRLEVVERGLADLDPKLIAQLASDNRETKEWIKNFNRGKHIAWIIASGGFMFIGYYLPIVVNSLKNLLDSFK